MRLLLRAVPVLLVLALAPLAPAAAHPRHGHPSGSDGDYARHALRSGLTDQDFYFVMGDRFQNGDPVQRRGRPR